ncbi:MAG: energy-coupling factor transporter transmembrane protein EcfT, partial [Oscillospiraceae bacterium]|nr:energy-coupling factor transporter transmembrane protein EcfT [Oscillospiraceae bacterium]
VPPTFTTVFEMTYRYIGTLFDEAYSMYVAYGLRGGGGRGIRVGHMGGFVGQLLLRSVDRSERVYAAMRCRGYPLPASPAGARRLGPKDAAYVAATLAAFTALRLIDMGGLIADMIGGA